MLARACQCKAALRQLTPRAYVALLVVGLACLSYWWVLLDSQRTRLAYAEEQLQLRAQQTSQALALQVDTLMAGLKYTVHSLSVDYLSGVEGVFPHSVSTAFEAFPAGSIIQIAVADAQGVVVYSSLDRQLNRHYPPVSIAHREHFQVHAQGDDERLFISRPVLGKVSGKWSIQLSYPLRHAGRFAGVIVLSIAPDYISRYFREVFAGGRDVAMLLREDGYYLARSQHQEQVLDTRVPAGRKFLHAPQVRSGLYRVTSPVDGIERNYAWHRLANYPLVVSIGLERAPALAPVHKRIRESRLLSALGTLISVCAALWIALLFGRLRCERRLLEESEKRSSLALEGGGLGSWEWESGSRRIRFDARACAMLGHASGEMGGGLQALRQLIHPDDWARVCRAFDAHLGGTEARFDTECRMRHRNGDWRWISARGRIIARDDAGDASRLAGTLLDIGRRVAEAQLRRALLEHNAAALLLVGPDGTIKLANQRATEVFSVDGRSLDGSSAYLGHLDEASFAAFLDSYSLLRSGREVQVDTLLRDGRGELRWFAIQGTLLDAGQPEGDVIWTMLDITERRQAEEALSATRVRLTEVIKHFPGGVLVENEAGQVLVVNQKLCELLAIRVPADSLVGCEHAELCRLLAPDVCEAVFGGDSHLPLDERLHGGEVVLVDGRYLSPSLIPVRLGETDIGRQWIVLDVTERQQYERQLEQLACTDALSGLSNRGAFMARLKAELGSIAHGGPAGMLVMLDLDYFKRVNDTYGHAAGDAVLVHLAGLLRGAVRREDMVGRLGGEEFAVLLPATSPVDAVMLAERLRITLEQSHIDIGNECIQVTASLGIAALGADANDSLARADAALYAAKRGGRNRSVLAEEVEVLVG